MSERSGYAPGADAEFAHAQRLDRFMTTMAIWEKHALSLQ
jgi:hypothetical protein